MISNVITIFGIKTMIVTLLVFLPLEQLLPLCREQKILRPHWKNDLVYFLFNSLPIRLGLFAVTVLAIGIIDRCMPPSFQAHVAALPVWLQVAELILLADIGFYCAHRMFHAVPLLWKIHQVHHSIEHLDWLAGTRVHPLDQIITKGASLLLILPFGFSWEALGIGAMIYQFHSTLLHSNVHIPFGPLKWIIASPEFHRWHHGNEKEAYNCNFAGQISLLDIVFGTMHMPQGRAPAKYGIDNSMPQNYLTQMAYPFMDKHKSSVSAGLSEQTGS